MRLSEIGSEYWIEQDGDSRLVLSGRTAIDLICQDIASCRSLHTVYMPAYCCDSMVFPFIRQGMNVKFYDVVIKDGGISCLIDVDQATDILYINNYFGFSTGIDSWVADNFRKKGTVIIYDRTHDLFGRDIAGCDYSFCSLRKWMGIATGAIVRKLNGRFQVEADRQCAYAEEKLIGMRQKQHFLQGDATVTKEDFFSHFNAFNTHLHDDYQNYAIDSSSLSLLLQQDFESIVQQRRANVSFLYASLPQEMFLFPCPDNSVPLFVPILIRPEQRQALRQWLTQHNVYCPIHWPKGNAQPDCELYDKELSLLCDQRYCPEELSIMTNLIRDYCKC